MTKGVKSKRLTFEFSRGWMDHYNGVSFNNKEHPDWQDGWMGRQVYLRSIMLGSHGIKAAE